MRRLILLLIFFLFIAGCNESELSNDLNRIELSLSSQTIGKMNQLENEFIFNREKWATAFIKAQYIVNFGDSVLRIIHSSKYKEIDILNVISSFENIVSELNLKNEYNRLLREQKLTYWRSKSNKESLRLPFAIDIRLCIIDILDELYDQVDLNNYCFNVVKPVIIDSVSTVAQGETYKAYIGLLAYDSTMVPEYRLNEYYLDIQGGRGIYSASSNTKGEKIFSGRIILPKKNHLRDTLYYTGSFEVK